MIIGVVKETKEYENRVALSPEVVKLVRKKGFDVVVEAGAGEKSYFSDQDYEAAGATIGSSKAALEADLILKVNLATLPEIAQMKEGAAYISYMYAYQHPEVIAAFNAKRISTFSMDAVPRISRAQKMDALSSQANLAGYKAVLLGANYLGKIFPLLMTASGTITPARVLIFGAGVAGLQAIATAKRLGAVVECTDVRPETKEQVESLGGRFLTVEGAEGVKTEGGYAREVSAEYLEKQQQLIREKIKEADLVITTALVMGKKSPILVTEDMVKSMKTGSVIVDMAVESGGNCALSEINATVVKHGVTLVGESNLPSLLPVNASQLYATNISTLAFHLAGAEGLALDIEEEITKGVLITHEGVVVHPFTKQLLSQ
ncbi:MAG: Re/Si-specific NAD(P)(+) transhydrogenase subunit alpha [Algoriphagus sp.]|jgi:H+-translocating NAD(P) transhydrogenase subunit alpha|uniref:Re/Si-specific NAD(P)(+) transhydrogenase subunit alpha n=1 Tax=Algoriphagus sp. TaxID=1872435 RepID=UPI00274F4984|nr:Re/Si-specific NAD(P)(+) transhydrogenase subunit alpha [Algoriphagus sp.]MDP4748172.1 Re/Si-specific NAD(P)(+) transhydrogenase subunit alpha [Algoriphagus sp.]MDP4838752.1 Re/Si-specific NAD(P)(+) transhydrogenase subunit alpha [Algoriphagus sp.]MDP4904674.1 Re/Si-specific NAD(P)(+) transhydrogenase subunit alpha [Algoriphagus sp.]MDP4957071.1 Re/Si-specific NAD(P)(+) transhydrogenase subunit alpha [Algoriphagus sp.]